MFFGEHQHSLDDKGRVILPSRFRDQLADGAFVTSEVDGCLSIWRAGDFDSRAREMRELARGAAPDRGAARAFFADTVDFTPDRQGRVAIPAHLRAFAHLEREVVITGQFDRIEIWDADAWKVQKRTGQAALLAGVGGNAATETRGET
jgi:MraZ protein